MKIVFLGSPEPARIVLHSLISEGHTIDLVITQPDRPAGRGKRMAPSPVKSLAIELGLPVLQPPRIRKDSSVGETLNRLKPEINVVVAYGQIIPASIIYLPKHNSINLHFSLLPKFRGASPVQWAIISGEVRTGVTIFELDEKMDEGPILAQLEVTIHPHERAYELESRLTRIGAELMLETIAQIESIQPRPQDHSLASYAPLIKKNDGRIDWDNSSIQIERLIRAFSPWPSTFSFLEQKRIKILSGKVLDKRAVPGSTPGQVLEISPEGIEICCGKSGVFLITELQPENRKPMAAYAFSLGANLKPGQHFS